MSSRAFQAIFITLPSVRDPHIDLMPKPAPLARSNHASKGQRVLRSPPRPSASLRRLSLTIGQRTTERTSFYSWDLRSWRQGERRRRWSTWSTLFLAPLSAEAHLLTGIAYHLSGDALAAAHALRAAVLLDSDLWLGSFYLALTYEKLERMVEAKREYRRVDEALSRRHQPSRETLLSSKLETWKEDMPVWSGAVHNETSIGIASDYHEGRQLMTNLVAVRAKDCDWAIDARLVSRINAPADCEGMQQLNLAQVLAIEFAGDKKVLALRIEERDVLLCVTGPIVFREVDDAQLLTLPRLVRKTKGSLSSPAWRSSKSAYRSSFSTRRYCPLCTRSSRLQQLKVRASPSLATTPQASGRERT